jgi:tol-pal system protein YbgF
MKINVKVYAVLAVLAGVIVMPHTGMAQIADLAQRISRLEQDLADLQRQAYTGSGQPSATNGAQAAATGGQGAYFLSRLNDMDETLRTMTGQLEELSFKTRQMEGRLDRLVKDVDYRLQQVEQTLQAAGLQAPAANGQAQDPYTYVDKLVSGKENQPQVGGNLVPQTGATALLPASSPDNTGRDTGGGATDQSPEDMYKDAFALLRRAQYSEAEVALRAFVNQYPDHELAGNAQYWLGETFYIREKYADAARTFLEGYKKFPNSSKAPDNLLKLALSMARLGQNDPACQSLGRLGTEFPKAPKTILNRAEKERKNLNCQ